MASSDQPISINKAVLARFEPMARLSPNRLDELAAVCFLEQVSQNLDPTRMHTNILQALYLVEGDLGIRYEDGKMRILRGNTDAAKHPIDAVRLRIKDSIAITDLQVVRIDLDLLDIMLTWDQLSGRAPIQAEKSAQINQNQPWKFDKASFKAFRLQNGIFNMLPPANIQAMFERMESIMVEAGQVMIRQGQEGDYYYLIQSGTAHVTRVKDTSQPPIFLAEISDGTGFGEEALASDNKRNATVTMKTDGQLLRLKKQDFVELLKAPIVKHINKADATDRVSKGAVWLDVRYATEFEYSRIDGAINAPLHELRGMISQLDDSKEYIVYCQTGRRSSAAAFILAQFGFEAWVLEGGTRGAG
jgi:rhodanese-related sulfurtransferase